MNVLTRCFGQCLCIKSQSKSINSIGLARRWIIYITGLLETILFGGCIFGWAQLAYVLKNEGIFYDLCDKNIINSTFPSNKLEYTTYQENYHGCDEQDKAFALIYIIAAMAFGVPAVLMGMLLHYCGLATGRIAASIILTAGFLALGFTTKENSEWLYVAMVCLALGGNQIRMSGLQLCNLFPKYRSTALAVISGSYAASPSLFFVFQLGQQYGMSLRNVSIILAGITSVSFPMTFLIPWHHIPYERSVSANFNEAKSSIWNSIFSLSGFTQIFWQSVNLVVFTSYAITYNSWISDISKTNEEAGHYSSWYSISCIFCPLLSPFPGMFMDYLTKTLPESSEDSTEEYKLHKNLRSVIIPLGFVTTVSLALRSSLFFNTSGAIYCSLTCMVILRSFLFASGNTFIRMRFPADHFDRIVGLQTTLESSFNAIQYPLFVWAQNNFRTAMVFCLCILCLTFIHPLHIYQKWYLKTSKADERQIQENNVSYSREVIREITD